MASIRSSGAARWLRAPPALTRRCSWSTAAKCRLFMELDHSDFPVLDQLGDLGLRLGLDSDLEIGLRLGIRIQARQFMKR